MSFDWDKYHEYEVKYLKKSNDNDFLNMWEVNTLYEGEMFQKESYDFFFDFYYYIITQYANKDGFAEANRLADSYYEKLQTLLVDYLNLNIVSVFDLTALLKEKIKQKKQFIEPIKTQKPQEPQKNDMLKNGLYSYDEYKQRKQKRWIEESLNALDEKYTENEYIKKLWNESGLQSQASSIETWFSGIPKEKLSRAKNIASFRAFSDDLKNSHEFSEMYNNFKKQIKNCIINDIEERMKDETKQKQEYAQVEQAYMYAKRNYEAEVSKYKDNLIEYQKEQQRFDNEQKYVDSLEKDIEKLEEYLLVFQKKDEIKDKQYDEYRTRDEFIFSEVLDLLPLPNFFNQLPINKSLPTSIQPGLHYNKDNNILIVNYFLPSVENIPTEKKIYISNREVKIQYHTDSFIKKLYNTLVYDIAFIIIDLLFKTYGETKAIVFNGYVKTLDKATGKPISPCVMSVHIDKEQWKNIDLRYIDAKVCFKQLKGISVANIETAIPIIPILTFDKNNKKFIKGYNVETNSGTNLAAMDWQDFENLVRELFEWEFSKNGGEVKITQASRDGGVDAVIFDPDPIRGGKIIVQAKRYTNTVDVSAVRDLYGTLLNEGANKGILITTSNYGVDSYNFAKDKPITLLNGANLLGLLEKHGKQAYIDIPEAKKLL